MKITAHKYWAFENSFTGNAFSPDDIEMSRGQIELWVEEYLAEYPMPEDEAYSEDGLIEDMAYSCGEYTVDVEAKQETIDYILEMLNKLCSQGKEEGGDE